MDFLQQCGPWDLRPKYRLAPTPCHTMCIQSSDDESFRWQCSLLYNKEVAALLVNHMSTELVNEL